MSSRLGIEEKNSSTQTMLCPCCGRTIFRGAHECSCGARFVGEPLDDTPIKVQRLAPTITSVVLLVTVTVAAIIATRWVAFAAALVVWSSWRAVRLAKRDPVWYGGYKTAVWTLAVSIAGSAALAAYGLAFIPQLLDNYWLRQRAATNAAMYPVANLLDEYKRTYGSYPRNAQEYKKAIGESLPADYWGRSIKYQSYTDAIADRSIEITGIPFDNFELRSAGPDGILGTDDDIVMRDGILLTTSEMKKQPVVQQLR